MLRSTACRFGSASFSPLLPFVGLVEISWVSLSVSAILSFLLAFSVVLKFSIARVLVLMSSYTFAFSLLFISQVLFFGVLLIFLYWDVQLISRVFLDDISQFILWPFLLRPQDVVSKENLWLFLIVLLFLKFSCIFLTSQKVISHESLLKHANYPLTTTFYSMIFNSLEFSNCSQQNQSNQTISQVKQTYSTCVLTHPKSDSLTLSQTTSSISSLAIFLEVRFGTHSNNACKVRLMYI